MGACSSRVAHAVDPEPLAQVVCDPETVKTSAPTNEPLDLLVTALNRHLKECMYYETTSGGFTVQVTCATLANRMMHDNDYRPLVVTDANVTALLTAAGWNVHPTKHYLRATLPAPRRAVTTFVPTTEQLDLLVTALNKHLEKYMYYESTSGGFTVQVTCATLAIRMMHDNDYHPLVVTDANVTALLTAAGWNVRPTKHYLWATHPAPRRAVTVPALPDVHQVDGVRARSPVALAGTLVGNSRTATEYRTAAEDNKDNADPDSKRGACKDGIVFAMLAEQHI